LSKGRQPNNLFGKDKIEDEFAKRKNKIDKLEVRGSLVMSQLEIRKS
jgi:hypothetical protein